jgi:hypothetical protein
MIMNQQTKEFLNKNEILNSALIGFEFEFFSNKKFNSVASELSEVLGKRVKTGFKSKGKKEKIPGQHREISVDYNNYKLIHDFSGGKSMMELVTGPTPFFEAKVVLAKVLNWIKLNGRTNDRSGIHVNISFNKFSLPDKNLDITSLDVLKLILTFDEDFVFSRFPNRKDNVFARSIDYVFPTDLFSFNDNISSINRSSFTVPDEKHFGFNFAKLANGYLEMRYMGGKDYEDHIKEILECMDYAVSTIYDCLSKPGYTEENVTRLRGRLIEHKKFINGIINHKVFSVFYKKIEIYVDLKNSDQLLATYWEEYRKVLFDLIYKNGLKSGFINLDIDLHRYQVKDGVFEKPWSLSSYDLVDCKLKNSTLDQCTMIGCKVKSSQVSFCEIMIDNTIDDSKIKSCHIKTLHNTFTNCYIDNMPHNVKGNIVNCIIRSGGISDLTTMDNKTVVVSV